MGIGDEIREHEAESTAIVLAKIKRERDIAKKENLRLTTELDGMRKALVLVEKMEGATIEPPKWLTPKKPKNSAATLVAMLSDTHFDEVVNPDEINGLNAYNREIAVMRLEKWATNLIKMARHYLAGINYDGIVVILGGDIFSGDIHDELKETNEDTMLGSVLFWAEEISAAIGLLAEEFGSCHVVSVMGNHGRTTRKPRAKLRAKTNFDWLIAKMIERHFASNKNISFQIPESADALTKVYETGLLITHGDQVNGGGGIGGIYPPIMRLRARKQQNHQAIGSGFDSLLMGHWHSYLSTPTLTINGSLKGFDEYAAISNFGFEPPQQAMLIVTPERGITIQAPIFCQDRKKEGW